MIFFENIKRFKNIYNKIFLRKIKIKDNINFGSHQANLFFLKNLKRSKYYFEYGSGSSTLVANKFKKKFLSIELDKIYYNILKKKINIKGKIKLINIGPVGEFSYPLFRLKKKIKNYIESIDEEFKKKNSPDLVLVDGRFRVACCLNLLKFERVKNNFCTIIIDDYVKRKEYHILSKFFYINKIGRLALLKSRNSSKKKIIKSLNQFYKISK